MFNSYVRLLKNSILATTYGEKLLVLLRSERVDGLVVYYISVVILMYNSF